MKLMLFLSHNGILSRRKAFEAIKDGAVTVNGRIDREPSANIDPARDQVAFHGRLVNDKIFEYVILNKPQGYVTTCEKQFDQQTVLDLLPKELKHLRPAGRLDKDTEGLLLFTNDGELANQMAHPGFNVDKTYLARVRGMVSEDTVRKLEEGIVIDGRKTYPAQVEVGKADENGSEIQITIHEGRKHQVRLMGDAVGHTVVYLKRLRQGPLVLGSLRPGEWRRLSDEEMMQVKSIRRSVKGPRKKEFRPMPEENRTEGRRGRGELNREQRLLRNSREREKERLEVAARSDRRRQPRAGYQAGQSRPGRFRSADGQAAPSRPESAGRPDKSRPSRPEYSASRGHRGSPRSGDSQAAPSRPENAVRSDKRRPPRPVYSSSQGHRSSPRSGEAKTASPRPLFSSHSDQRRHSSTREWHSDSDVHAPTKT